MINVDVGDISVPLDTEFPKNSVDGLKDKRLLSSMQPNLKGAHPRVARLLTFFVQLMDVSARNSEDNSNRRRKFLGVAQQWVLAIYTMGQSVGTIFPCSLSRESSFEVPVARTISGQKEAFTCNI